MVEHEKSKSTQPRSQNRCNTLPVHSVVVCRKIVWFLVILSKSVLVFLLNLTLPEQGEAAAAAAEEGRLQLAPVQEERPVSAEEGPFASAAAGQKVSPKAKHIVARSQEDEQREQPLLQRRRRRRELHQHREREERGEPGQRRVGREQLRDEDEGGEVQRQAGVAAAGQALQDRVRDEPVRRPARARAADVRRGEAADRVGRLGEGGQGARDDRRHLQGQSRGEFSPDP